MATKLNDNYLKKFISDNEYLEIKPQVQLAHELLHSKKGAGSNFTGWVDLPENYDKDEFYKIKKCAEKIKSNSDIFIVIGIGGSYLGARAAIEFLKSSSYNSLTKDFPQIYFAGNNMSSDSLNDLLSICKGKDISINIISKSGTTTEPAIAFRIFRDYLEQKYGKDETKNRIYCTTDKTKGTLKKLAEKEGYETFIIPDNIGGRFSILTAVGLLPIAVCGVDIENFMIGANEARLNLLISDLEKNDCYKYAAIRNILYRKGKNIEILVNYEPSFSMMSEWFKQLFGESEGKNNKGIFPASATFSTDLHSLGQFIQDGTKMLFETVVLIDKSQHDIILKNDIENIDGLNFMQGKSISYINKKAFQGTVLAHTDGNIPNIILNIPERNERELGYLIYFFEKACAISGYILGVNPFDQPGVESYKKNMFALLGKPGYENEKLDLEKKLI